MSIADGQPAHQHGAQATGDPKNDRISEIISEFSEIFASARSSWSRFAEDVHPELTGASMIMLQFILRKGPVTATGMSQVMSMDKAMVSRQVTRLRELDFVVAEPAPEDRRVQLLTASPKAVEIMESIKQRWAHSYHERFAGWSADEVTQFGEMLHRFNASSAVIAKGPAAKCARDHQDPASA